MAASKASLGLFNTLSDIVGVGGGDWKTQTNACEGWQIQSVLVDPENPQCPPLPPPPPHFPPSPLYRISSTQSGYPVQ
ncbi:hypothetical protein JZ751_023096, partial [Albula glossodonta]